MALAVRATFVLTVLAFTCVVAAAFVAVFIDPGFVKFDLALFVMVAIASVLAISAWLRVSASLLSTGWAIPSVIIVFGFLGSS